MKSKRQEVILSIIKENIILTQEDLQNALLNMVYEVTQSTVSRDIKELKLVKGHDALGNYRYIYNDSASSYKNNLSLIECQLFSGRKHQIRVHMSYLGYPLLGDKLYGKESTLINRQALHAYKLDFIHPITKEKMTLTCHPPYDMKKIIQLINPTL